MKFSTKEDVEIPIDELFVMLSDFDAFEQMAMRQGMDVSRLDDATAPCEGMTWSASGEIRGRKRDIAVELERYNPPTEMVFLANSSGIRATFRVDLIALSRKRTRMRVELDMRPKTLPARLIIQSARLARNTLNRRYKTRVQNYAEDLQDRYMRSLNA